MKEFFREFFKDKKNIVFVVLSGIALVSIIISAFWEFFTAISCILFGIVCLDVAYLLVLRYFKIKKKRTEEFMQNENAIKRKTTKFLESEGKVNNLLLIALFAMMGGILIFYGLNMF